MPRNFWFVKIKSDVRFSFDPSLPFVQTAQSAIKTAKKEYKDVRMSGNTGHIRKFVKLELEKELREIDGLVRGILEIKK